MIELVLCVITCSSLLLFFKIFEKYHIDFFQAIVFNYITCALLGVLFIDINHLAYEPKPWMPIAIALGSLFISIFYLSSQTTRLLGISTATIAMKLAVVFPIIIGMFIYGERAAFSKIIGIVLALVAVILCSWKERNHHEFNIKLLLYPMAVWLGSGACDSLVQYAKIHNFQKNGSEAFIMIVFAIAALWGLIILLFNRNTIRIKNIIGGISLGIPNYFTMYFVFKAMTALKEQYQIDSSIFFPINNISIVLVSTAIAVLFFKEKLSQKNLLGLILAVIATLLLFID
ncbi:MAG: EamA family transporter [Bacteroidetes bacterium]|nr:EamA family transporter [Bacteroidota bacterium]